MASTGFLTWTSSCPSRLKMVIAATPSRSCCSVEVGGERLALALGEQPVALDHLAPCSARGGARWTRGSGSRSGPPPCAWSSGRSTWGLNQPSMEVVMKFDAMRKIRMPGISDEGQEGEDQLGLEAGADDLVAALEGELDEVAEQQHQQQQEDDQVQVEEAEDDEVRGERDLGRADAHLEDGGHHQQDQDAADDEQVALALLLLVGPRGPTGERRHWLRTGVSSARLHPRRLLGLAGHAGEPGVDAAEGDVGAHPHVVELLRVERGDRGELSRPAARRSPAGPRAGPWSGTARGASPLSETTLYSLVSRL